MARNDSALRILEIGRLLESAPQGLTIKELHDRLTDLGFEAGQRTVYRDIEAASLLFPIHEEEGSKPTRFCMQPLNKVTRYLVLNARELFALYLARGALLPLQNTPFYEDLDAVFQKIDGLIGDKGLAHLRELQGHLKFEALPKWGLGLDPDILETIRAACTERHCLKTSYRGTKDAAPKDRQLGPHFLYYSKGGIYLVAEDLEKGEVRTYSLPRFAKAEMTSVPYESEALDPTDYFKGSFGVFSANEPTAVELEFNSTVAPFVSERVWHPSQRVTHLAGGTIRMKLEVGITPEFFSWVLSFGSNALIAKPESLRKQILAEAENLKQLYGKKRAG